MSFEARIERFLEDRQLPFKSAKRSFILDCVNPTCGKEEHLWIRKSTGRAICFRCSSRWSWIALVARVARCSMGEARQLFYGEGAGECLEKPLDIDELFNTKKEDEEQIDHPILMGPDFVPVRLSKGGFEYANLRAPVEADVPNWMDRFDLRFHAVMNAVVFPMKRDGVIYGWQARKIAPAPGELRMLSSMFNKSRFLLNWDSAKHESKIILVEGPFDCVQVDVPGYGAVASLGKGVSTDQIRLLLESGAESIYLALDPDATEEVDEVFERIGLGKKVYRMLPPDHRKDFGECTKEEVQAAIKNAVLWTSHTAMIEIHFK